MIKLICDEYALSNSFRVSNDILDVSCKDILDCLAQTGVAFTLSSSKAYDALCVLKDKGYSAVFTLV